MGKRKRPHYRPANPNLSTPRKQTNKNTHIEPIKNQTKIIEITTNTNQNKRKKITKTKQQQQKPQHTHINIEGETLSVWTFSRDTVILLYCLN